MVRAALAAVLIAAALQAHSADGAEVVWHCWFETSKGYAIRCLVPGAAPEDDEPNEIRKALLAAGRAEEATRLVRAMPHAFQGITADIPTYSPAYNGWGLSARLAKAVMCRGKPSCRIAFDPRPAPGPALVDGR